MLSIVHIYIAYHYLCMYLVTFLWCMCDLYIDILSLYGSIGLEHSMRILERRQTKAKAYKSQDVRVLVIS